MSNKRSTGKCAWSVRPVIYGTGVCIQDYIWLLVIVAEVPGNIRSGLRPKMHNIK